LDKPKACLRRLQNSPAAQTVVIADLTLRQALLAKTLSMAAQTDIFGATSCQDATPFLCNIYILHNNFFSQIANFAYYVLKDGNIATTFIYLRDK